MAPRLFLRVFVWFFKRKEKETKEKIYSIDIRTKESLWVILKNPGRFKLLVPR